MRSCGEGKLEIASSRVEGLTGEDRIDVGEVEGEEFWRCIVDADITLRSALEEVAMNATAVGYTYQFSIV